MEFVLMVPHHPCCRPSSRRLRECVGWSGKPTFVDLVFEKQIADEDAGGFAKLGGRLLRFELLSNGGI